MADEKVNESFGGKVIFYGFWIALAAILLYYPLRAVWSFFTAPDLVLQLGELLVGFAACGIGLILVISILLLLGSLDRTGSDKDDSVYDHTEYY